MRMESLRRHKFMRLSRADAWKAYCLPGMPEPIGNGQTISAENVILMTTMLSDLNKDEVVLEIGTGSGRQAAIAAGFCKEVHTIERIKALYEYARENLAGLKNVFSYHGDGLNGIPDKPDMRFDKIIVTATSTHEDVTAISRFLKEGGLLIAPVNNDGLKQKSALVVYRKEKDKLQVIIEVPKVKFVPLLKGTEKGSSSETRNPLNVDIAIAETEENILALRDYLKKETPPGQCVISFMNIKDGLQAAGLYITDLGADAILQELAKRKNPIIKQQRPGKYLILPENKNTQSSAQLFKGKTVLAAIASAA